MVRAPRKRLETHSKQTTAGHSASRTYSRKEEFSWFKGRAGWVLRSSRLAVGEHCTEWTGAQFPFPKGMAEPHPDSWAKEGRPGVTGGSSY